MEINPQSTLCYNCKNHPNETFWILSVAATRVSKKKHRGFARTQRYDFPKFKTGE